MKGVSKKNKLDLEYYKVGYVKRKKKRKSKDIRITKRCKCGRKVPSYHHSKCDKCWQEEKENNIFSQNSFRKTIVLDIILIKFKFEY